MGSNKRLIFNQPAKPCKFMTNRECYLEYSQCEHCTRNPHRFDGRPITKGQVIFLKEYGYSEEELLTWDFNKASETIDRLK